MNTEIEFSPSYSLLTVHLEPDEIITAEPGSMVAKQGVELQTETSGAGVVGGFRRVLGGESFLVNRFTGGPEGGWVMLAPPAPGDIQERQLVQGADLFIQKGSFLAGSYPVELSSKFQGFRGVLSGEGLFFLRAYVDESPGKVFFHSYGALRQIVLEPGRELVVDTGHLVAFTGGVDYLVRKVGGGIRSMIGSGEGLVMELSGSGLVWVQTRNLSSLTAWMKSLLKDSDSG